MARKIKNAENDGYGLSFWEKVQSLFSEPVPSKEKVRLTEAVKRANYLVSHHLKSLWYDLRWIRLTVDEFKNFNRAKYRTLSDLEGDGMDVLANDFTQYKVARAFRLSLNCFKNRGVHIEEKRRHALQVFHKYIFAYTYAQFSGLKHNDLVLKQIHEAILIICSVVYRIPGTARESKENEQ